MVQTVYKVLLANAADDDIAYSSAIPTFKDHIVTYHKNKKVAGNLPGSLLYAFSTYAYAEQYYDKPLLGDASIATLQIWECQAEVTTLMPYMTLIDVDRFWKERWFEITQQYPYVMPCPPGSVWCEWIELKEMMWGMNPRRKVKNIRYR